MAKCEGCARLVTVVRTNKKFCIALPGEAHSITDDYYNENPCNAYCKKVTFEKVTFEKV